MAQSLVGLHKLQRCWVSLTPMVRYITYALGRKPGSGATLGDDIPWGRMHPLTRVWGQVKDAWTQDEVPLLRLTQADGALCITLGVALPSEATDPFALTDPCAKQPPKGDWTIQSVSWCAKIAQSCADYIRC
jgi:hypothetical protein